MAMDNKTIGRFQLAGIPPAPRGMPQIEVTFDIDADGILNVSAKDKATGKEQKIVIQASSGLSDEEISRMVTDAESFKEEDRQKRETIDSRNTADQLVHQTEKNLDEYKDKLDSGDADKLKAGIEEIQAALKSNVPEEIKSSTDKLNATWQEVAQRMYQNASQETAEQEQAAGGDGQPTGPTGGEEVTEAEFEVIDEEKEEKQEKQA
jgi:molecular chaperone DnaK